MVSKNSCATNRIGPSMGSSCMRSKFALLVLASLLAPAPAHAGAEGPPPGVAWPQVGTVGVHRLHYDHLYLPARPKRLPETLQVVILDDHDPRRNRIVNFRPCCARRRIWVHPFAMGSATWFRWGASAPWTATSRSPTASSRGRDGEPPEPNSSLAPPAAGRSSTSSRRPSA